MRFDDVYIVEKKREILQKICEFSMKNTFLQLRISNYQLLEEKKQYVLLIKYLIMISKMMVMTGN